MGLRIKGDPPGLQMRPPLLATPPAGVRPRTRHAALANRSNAVQKPERNPVVDAKHRLSGKAFVLDIMDHKVSATIEKDIQKFGGKVVYNIDEVNPPYMFVSDHAYTKHFEDPDIKHKEEVMRKVPMMIRDACNLRIHIRHTTSFMKSLLSLKRKAVDAPKPPGRPTKVAMVNSNGVLQRRLTGSYIRIDDMSKQFAPFLREYRDCYAPSINLGMYFGQSLFHRASEEQQQRKKDEIEDELKNGIAAEEPEGPEEPAEADETAGPGELADSVETADFAQRVIKARYSSGFCENCQKSYKDQHTHYNSAQHKKTVNKKGFYDEVDSLLGSFVSNIQCPGKPLLRRRKPPSKEASPALDSAFEYYPETFPNFSMC